mgnify:CR=1 FL=1
MSDTQHTDSLAMFIDDKINISAKILISLRDEEKSVVKAKTKININARPLSFIVRITNHHYKGKLSWRVAKWQRNNKQESDVCALEATFGNHPVTLNFKKTGLCFHRVTQKLHSKTSQWTFVMDNLSFSHPVESSEAHTYYRLTETANVLGGDLNGIEIKDGSPIFVRYKRELKLNGETFVLFYEMKGKNKRMFIETDGDVNRICALLSFYAGGLVEWDMKIADNNGTRTVSVREPYYKSPTVKSSNEPLKYMVTGKDCLDHLYVYEDGIVANGTNMNEDLSQNIELYTRAILLDNRSRFLTYYSIIEKMGTETDGIEISQYLEKKNIDYDKLSCGIASNSIKDRQGEVISNIRDLRNEIVHHIGSPKIDEFMRKSDIISRMQYAACMIILWQMGFKDIRFVKEFNRLSVFNDKVKPYDYFKENNLR